MSIGVKKIKIPLRKNELTKENIEPYLYSIMQEFKTRQEKIRKDYNTYKGEHSVLNKTRAYDSDSAINNKVVVPHLQALVDFKCGYTLGNPKEYALISGENPEEMNQLKSILTDADIRTIDNDVTEWVYATGIGYYFIQPRTITPDNPTPFEIFCQPATTCCKVYSSYIGEEPLFDLIVTDIKEQTPQNSSNEYKILSMYLPDVYYEYKYTGEDKPVKIVKTQLRPIYKMLPLVEKYYNTNRIGIVAIGRTLQDAIDNIVSNQVDNIDDVVNQIVVFINVMLGEDNDKKKDNYAAMKKNGVIELLPSNPQLPADVKTLSVKLDHKETIEVVNYLVTTLYDCCGVPLPSKAVGSGNNGASEVGAGWSNAYTIILKDINNLIKADRDLLRHILFICHKSQGTNLDNINSNNILIKYNINRSNNLLVKSQSYSNFVTNNVPPAIALSLCELTSDPDTLGKQIADYQAEIAQENENNTNVDIQ